MSATLDQWGQLMATVRQDLSNAWNLIARDVSFAQQQWMQLLGIPANAQNQSLGAAVPRQTGANTTTAQEAPPPSPIGSGAKPPVSNQPLVEAPGGFLWDPTSGTNASIATNWDLGGQPQNNPATALKPGDPKAAGDGVTFDPAATQAPGLHGQGAQPITWDYNATFPTMNLGGPQTAYTSKQTINAGITVHVNGSGVTAINTASNLYLFFTSPPQGGGTAFLIDGASTITNMKLAGAYNGIFQIDSGITNIAQSPGYTETIGVNFSINPGATLIDWGYNTLLFTNDNVTLAIIGTMEVLYGVNPTNTLIDNGGNVDDFINVWGGTLMYLGSGGITDTFIMPVKVANGGTFDVSISNSAQEKENGKLIVQGANSSTSNYSVYMVDDNSSVQLTFGDTLECDSGYAQQNGTLESMDYSTCTLQSGPNGALGTVNIAGDSFKIDQPFPTGYQTFNVNCSTLNFAGTYYPAINAQAQGAKSCDLLNVTGTTNLQGASLSVIVNNAPPNGGSIWVIIQDGAGNNIQNGGNLPIKTNTGTISTVTVLAVRLPPWRREVLGAAIPVVNPCLFIAA
ncbi:MAG: hypothetical protein ACYC3I_05680 [Gemmataceae bacterium]